MDKIITFLHTWQNLTRAFEATLIDNLAATTPWLAPVIPAYLVYRNLVDKLGFNQIVAGVAATTVEFVGLATVHTVFALWDYNQAKRKSDQSSAGRFSMGVPLRARRKSA